MPSNDYNFKQAKTQQEILDRDQFAVPGKYNPSNTTPYFSSIRNFHTYSVMSHGEYSEEIEE